MIELENLSRTYEIGGEPVHALVEVSESIAAGEHVAIMGPSGSGKSTLLHLIGCLDRPTSGSYRFEGREVSELAEAELDQLRQNRFGFIFQAFHLVPRLDGLGNVELPMVFAEISARRAARAGARGARSGRSRAARRSPPERAVGRRAPASGDRPRARHATESAAGGRADR